MSVDARVPGVQLDAAEVDHPRERGRVVDDREDRRVAARELDELLADVVRDAAARASGGRSRRRRRSGSAPCGTAAAAGAAARSRRRRGSTGRGRPSSARARGKKSLSGFETGTSWRPTRIGRSIARGRVAPCADPASSSLSLLALAGCRLRRRRRRASPTRRPRGRVLREGRPQPRQRRHSSRSAPTTPPSRRGSAATRRRRGRSAIPRPARASRAPSRTRSREQLGFAQARGRSGSYVPFNTSFAPGPKKFDFDINQISFTPARAKAVDFSDSYYDVNQAIVVRQGDADRERDVDRRALKPYKLGAQLGTTSYDYISRQHQAVASSRRCSTRTTPRSQALKNKQIDGLVVDLPTAFYVTAVQVAERQDPRPVPDEHDAASTSGWSSRRATRSSACVNQRAGAAEGRRHAAADPAGQWLAKATGAPVLK